MRFLSVRLAATRPGMASAPDREQDGTMTTGKTSAIVHFGHGWMSHRCVDCGQPKPLWTAYCDRCAERHGLAAS